MRLWGSVRPELERIRLGRRYHALAAFDVDVVFHQLAVERDAIDAEQLGSPQFHPALTVEGVGDQDPLGVLEDGLDLGAGEIGVTHQGFGQDAIGIATGQIFGRHP